jgi:hypothetical protein
MKKTNKPNPLKVFNDNKAMAYKKAGGAMSAYKKSLKKYQAAGPVDNKDINAFDFQKAKEDARKLEESLNFQEYMKNYPSDVRRNTNMLMYPEKYFVKDTIPNKAKKGGVKMKVGGSTKAAKFAALAPPYNKPTAADRIAGAKKNARKK